MCCRHTPCAVTAHIQALVSRVDWCPPQLLVPTAARHRARKYEGAKNLPGNRPQTTQLPRQEPFAADASRAAGWLWLGDGRGSGVAVERPISWHGGDWAPCFPALVAYRLTMPSAQTAIPTPAPPPAPGGANWGAGGPMLATNRAAPSRRRCEPTARPGHRRPALWPCSPTGRRTCQVRATST